jgi:hypothetical protein
MSPDRVDEGHVLTSSTHARIDNTCDQASARCDDVAYDVDLPAFQAVGGEGVIALRTKVLGHGHSMDNVHIALSAEALTYVYKLVQVKGFSDGDPPRPYDRCTSDLPKGCTYNKQRRALVCNYVVGEQQHKSRKSFPLDVHKVEDGDEDEDELFAKALALLVDFTEGEKHDSQEPAAPQASEPEARGPVPATASPCAAQSGGCDTQPSAEKASQQSLDKFFKLAR